MESIISLSPWPRGFSLTLINPLSVYISRSIYKWNEEGEARIHILFFILYGLMVALISAGAIFDLYNLKILDLQAKKTFLLTVIPALVLISCLIVDLPNFCNYVGRRIAFVFFSALAVWGKIAVIFYFKHVFSQKC